MALEGTIKTPLGPVQKKTALIIGGGIVILGAIVWMRQRNAASEPVDLGDTPINPATGYPYGSAEDAAALAEQGRYVSPPIPPSQGGSGNIPPSNVGFTTNGAWVQAVIEYMMSNDLVTDSSKLSEALGKYITGAYVNDGEVSLVQQAIAVQGYPPLAGKNGYPPSLNRTPVTTTPPPTTTPPKVTAPGAISGRVSTPGKTSIGVRFTGAKGASSYQVFLDGKLAMDVAGSPFTIPRLKPNTRYVVGVRAKNSAGVGPISNSTIRTLK